jgi:hypothetical protein
VEEDVVVIVLEASSRLLAVIYPIQDILFNAKQ